MNLRAIGRVALLILFIVGALSVVGTVMTYGFVGRPLTAGFSVAMMAPYLALKFYAGYTGGKA